MAAAASPSPSPERRRQRRRPPPPAARRRSRPADRGRAAADGAASSPSRSTTRRWPGRSTAASRRPSVVYQELVEGGATRFLAVYAAAPDVEVGPIRSVRESDLELLAAVRRASRSASPAATPACSRPSPQAAERDRSSTPTSTSCPDLYRRAEKRKDAYNFYASPAKLDGAPRRGAGAKDIGLRFGAAAARRGRSRPVGAASRFSDAHRRVDVR